MYQKLGQRDEYISFDIFPNGLSKLLAMCVIQFQQQYIFNL